MHVSQRELAYARYTWVALHIVAYDTRVVMHIVAYDMRVAMHIVMYAYQNSE